MATAELIDFTGKGRRDETWHAADMLIFTKSTRLDLSPGLMEKVKAMTEGEKLAELDYMSKTIPSSWEFADLTFLVSGVSRPTALQMVRTRTGSYAMQSQRVADLRDVEVVNPIRPEDAERHDLYRRAVDHSLKNYAVLRDFGVEPQDARGVLPQNTTANLVCKYNLRSFAELMIARSSLRAQGEYADIADQMKRAVIDVWPWAAPFFRPKHKSAIEILEGAVAQLGLEVGKGVAWDIAKAIDLIKKGGA